MKQYLLFQGSNYYPVGGWNDFAGDFDTIEEAMKARDKHSDWYHVIDSKTGDEVA